MKIRKFLQRDLRHVSEINRASLREPWPEKEIEKFLNSDGFIVAEEGGEIAGFAIGKISAGKGILKLIAVSPDYRGKGTGKNLVENIFGYFKKNRIKEVIAHSRMHNEAGCAFLKSFGFEIIETIKNYYLDGEDAYLMVRKL